MRNFLFISNAIFFVLMAVLTIFQAQTGNYTVAAIDAFIALLNGYSVVSLARTN